VFNAALVQSQNLDSDGDGLVNGSDPVPFLRSQDLGLKVTATNQPSTGVNLTWQSVPGSTNYAYYRPSLQSGSWLELTNFVLPDTFGFGPVSVFDPLVPGAARYYRVQVNSKQP
jgi:hypothetical protein